MSAPKFKRGDRVLCGNLLNGKPHFAWTSYKGKYGIVTRVWSRRILDQNIYDVRVDGVSRVESFYEEMLSVEETDLPE